MDPLSLRARTERQCVSLRINRSISVIVTGFSRDLDDDNGDDDDDEGMW